ncbi:hypothetical protein CPC08DRAFT_711128 [Agrocybe pediades]|nr:hypothetical protein CPC08DRAFT_711128 [Agrocybe pediades]
MISNAGATLVGAFLECLFYGIYIVTMLDTLRCILLRPPSNPNDATHLNRWRKPTGIRLITLAISLALFINCSSNLAFGIMNMIQIYILRETKKPSYWINIARPFNVATQNILADIFLIYRCWVVYDRSWAIIIVPALVWVASTVLSIYILIIRTRGALEIVGVPSKSLPAFLASQFATTIAVNIYATAFIVYRIYITDKQSRRVTLDLECREGMSRTTSPGQPDRTHLQRVMRILIESGLFYTLITVADFICVIKNSTLALIVSAINIVVIGITFNSIVIRVAAERARLRREAVGGSQMTTLKFASRLPVTRHSLALAQDLGSTSQASTPRGTEQDADEKEDLYP